MEKVTIYTTSGFLGNVLKREGRLVDCGQKPYAQYPNAPYVKYIPKGCRNVRGLVMGADPYVVVVKGHGHPSPDDVWVDVKSNGPFEMKKTKYLSFDKQYKIDFDQVLNDYLTDENTIMDCRKSAGTNVLPQEPAL